MPEEERERCEMSDKDINDKDASMASLPKQFSFCVLNLIIIYYVRTFMCKQ